MEEALLIVTTQPGAEVGGPPPFVRSSADYSTAAVWRAFWTSRHSSVGRVHGAEDLLHRHQVGYMGCCEAKMPTHPC
jgi:hypothetical protein